MAWDRCAWGRNRDAVLTLTMLEGREGLGTGLGLGAFMLIRLAMDGSFMELGLRTPADATPAGPGRPTLEARRGAAAGLGGGAAWMTVMVVGRTNMPRPWSQSK